MKNIAWLIPTHRARFSTYAKHYELTKKYAPSFKHFVVVQSTQEEVDLRELTDSDLNIINLEHFFSQLQISTFLKTRSIINVKKLFGLMQIYKNFDQVIISDDEIHLYDLLTPQDILRLQNNYYAFHKVSNKYLERIISSPLRILDNDVEKEIIFKIFALNNYYGWFSNLPVYESKYLPAFFSRYGLSGISDFDKITFEDFDFILYQYSLYLDNFDDVNFIFYNWDLPDLGGSLWEMYYIDVSYNTFVEQDLEKNMILWIPNERCKSIVPSAKMVFNIDRDYTPSRFSVFKIFRKLKQFVQK
jgi:hypothetical protein